MGSWSALPPPALRSETSSSTYSSKPTSHRGPTNTRTPPISPKDKPLTSSPRQKRTSSGMVKSNLTESIHTGPNGPSSTYALPPPPSRARKIIQMKPKGASSINQPSPESDASYRPPASVSASAAPAKGSNLSVTNSKRKQPSATSAAGRKIARKTAHSIIERRRRSKMNEEFGVLKDMIPACEGVEMHKLAILQAGIEYVKYLEGCVAQLKTENQKQGEAGEQGPETSSRAIDPQGFLMTMMRRRWLKVMKTTTTTEMKIWAKTRSFSNASPMCKSTTPINTTFQSSMTNGHSVTRGKALWLHKQARPTLHRLCTASRKPR